jgi:hypothetical protein
MQSALRPNNTGILKFQILVNKFIKRLSGKR